MTLSRDLPARGSDFLRYMIGSTLFENVGTFPPHDIIKLDEDNFLLVLAIAGYKKSDVEISLHQGVLNIIGTIEAPREQYTYLHKGIAERSFKRTFQIGENTEVVKAKMEDGILSISIRRILPPEARPKTISIG